MKIAAGYFATPEQFEKLAELEGTIKAHGAPVVSAMVHVYELAEWEWSAIRWHWCATKEHPWGSGFNDGLEALSSIVVAYGAPQLGEVLKRYRHEMTGNAQKEMDLLGFPVEFRIEPPEPYKPKFEDCSGMEKRKGAVGA